MTCSPVVRRLAALLVGMALLAEGRQGHAQPAHPPFAPTRDVTVTYALSGHVGAARGPDSVRIAIAAGGARARIEPIGFPAYLLAERARGHVVAVIDSLRAFSELRGSMAEAEKFLPNATMRFTRVGSDTLLGRRCTIWDMRGAGVTGRGCITDDGVILRGEAHWQDGDGRVQATDIDDAPLPTSTFEVPAGMRRLDLPPGLLGALPGQTPVR